jgi:translation initiation factor 3 subunit D
LHNAAVCGELSAYDEAGDRVSAKRPKQLKPFNGVTFEEAIWDDSTMVELMQENTADIYTTDVIVAALMCAGKSNYSWDIEIKRFGG